MQHDLSNNDFYGIFQIQHYIEQLMKVNKQKYLDNIQLKVFIDAYVCNSNENGKGRET